MQKALSKTVNKPFVRRISDFHLLLFLSREDALGIQVSACILMHVCNFVASFVSGVSSYFVSFSSFHCQRALFSYMLANGLVTLYVLFVIHQVAVALAHSAASQSPVEEGYALLVTSYAGM